MFRSGMHPCSLQLVGELEHGVGDTEIMDGTEVEKAQSILVLIADTMSADNTLPNSMVGTHSGVEVTQNYDLVITWDSC